MEPNKSFAFDLASSHTGSNRWRNAAGTRAMHFLIDASWDNEAKVWVASSDDELGLVAEAESLDLLMSKIRELVPELIELNGLTAEASSCPYDVLVHDNQSTQACA